MNSAEGSYAEPEQYVDEENNEEQYRDDRYANVQAAEEDGAEDPNRMAQDGEQMAEVDTFSNVTQGLVGKDREVLMQYWQDTINNIEHDDHKFKVHQLPLARIKKVMKADEDVKMISAEAPILFAKGCDIFITELTMRAWSHAEDNKRRTLQRSDIASALQKSDMFDFLIDIVPREEVTGKPRTTAQNNEGPPGYGQEYIDPNSGDQHGPDSVHEGSVGPEQPGEYPHHPNHRLPPMQNPHIDQPHLQQPAQPGEGHAPEHTGEYGAVYQTWY